MTVSLGVLNDVDVDPERERLTPVADKVPAEGADVAIVLRVFTSFRPPYTR